MKNEKGQFVKGHKETPEEKEKRSLAMKKSWINSPRRHNMVGTKIHNSWRSMITRCRGTAGEDSKKKYRDKGITVCERWSTFKNFYEDMSPTHKDGLTIDRIDNSKGYFKENCRWATPSQQANNKTVNVKINDNGVLYTIQELAQKYNKTYPTIQIRYYRKYKKGLIGFKELVS